MKRVFLVLFVFLYATGLVFSSQTIQFKRGLKANLPTGVAGEPLFCTDTKELYIGDGSTNMGFLKIDQTTAQTLTGTFTFPIVEAKTSLKIKEGGTSPTYYTVFQGGDQSGTLTYTLPIAYPVANNYGLISSTTGVLSWNDQALLTTSTPTFNTATLTQGLTVSAGASYGITKTTDDLPIVCASQKTVTLSPAVWDDLLPYSVNPGTGLTALGSEEYGTTGFKFLYWGNNTAANEVYQAFFQFSHKYKQGQAISLHLHVIPSANGSAGNEDVEFEIQYQWVNINGSYSTSTNTTVKDATTKFRVGASDANKHLLWDFADISGSGKNISSDLMVQIKRVTKTADRSADNYTGKVYLRFVDVHYEIDTLGSRQETAK